MPSYRRKPEDIGKIYVRSKTTDEMIPLSTLVTISAVDGTEITNRFNLFRSVEINGVPAPRLHLGPGARGARGGVHADDAHGDGLRLLVDVVPGEGRAAGRADVRRWRSSSSSCCSPRMYESWRLPWAVLLGSPLVALGAFFGVWLMGYDNNVYVQIGNIMLIGLAAKNAILIVEFAKAKHDEGMRSRRRRSSRRACASGRS